MGSLTGLSTLGKRCAGAALCGVMLLAGCPHVDQASKEGEALDAGVHEAMTRGDWKGVYASADPDMKAETGEQKFGALFVAVEKKLGHPLNSKQTGWKVSKTTSGTFLRSTCETKFSNDAAGAETFTWRMSDGKYRLYSYDIQSDKLLTR